MIRALVALSILTSCLLQGRLFILLIFHNLFVSNILIFFSFQVHSQAQNQPLQNPQNLGSDQSELI
jgi:hypothetical protein